MIYTRCSFILLLGFAVLGLNACSDAASRATDRDPPNVTSVIPKNDAFDVPPNAKLSVAFNERLDSNSINASNFTVVSEFGHLQGSITYDGATRTVIFQPMQALAPSTTYTVTVGTSIRDTFGNALRAPYIWQFTTGNLVDTDAPVTTVQPGTGLYPGPLLVTLTCDDGRDAPCAQIYYTTDGTEPSTGSNVYTVPLEISENTQLRFFAVDDAGNSEAVQRESFQIDNQPPVTEVSVSGGFFQTPQRIELSCTDPVVSATETQSGCAAIYFTTDGVDPDLDSSVAQGPIDISATTTLKYFAVDTAGNLEAIVTQLYTIDSSPPTASVTPANGSIIDTQTPIVLVFDESMDTNSAQLSGAMMPESQPGVWSTTAAADDTLTIRPAVSWSLGVSRTLTVDVNDRAGNAVPSQVLNYDVAVVHVSDSGNDSIDASSGTRDNPFLTIQAAIAFAKSQFTHSQVRVAQGAYAINAANGQFIGMQQGVSLLGGYAPDWSVRDPNNFVADIRDDSADGGTADAPNSAVVFAAGIDATTVLDGFNIRAGNGLFSSGILISNASTPTIRNNRILGGAPSQRSCAILELSSAHATIRNNEVDGGASLVENNGVCIGDNAATVLQNNTIFAGSGTGKNYAVNIQDATPVIQNNILFAAGGGTNYCVYEATANSDPSIFRNNDLFDCGQALYTDEQSNDLLDIAAVNSLADGGSVQSNISLDPVFVNRRNNDWRLSALTPQPVAEGGIEFTAFSSDKNGDARKAPWSIGAYIASQIDPVSLTIDFQGATNVPTYQEHGFSLSVGPSELTGVARASVGFLPSPTQPGDVVAVPSFPTLPSIGNFNSLMLVLTPNTGEYNALSIELVETGAAPTPQTLEISATTTLGETVTTQFTTDGIAGPQTFSFPASFTALVEMRIGGSASSTAAVAIDDIMVQYVNGILIQNIATGVFVR